MSLLDKNNPDSVAYAANVVKQAFMVFDSYVLYFNYFLGSGNAFSREYARFTVC